MAGWRMDSVVIPSIAEDADEFLSYNNYSAKFALLARNPPPRYVDLESARVCDEKQ
jgi:hypothetical protein